VNGFDWKIKDGSQVTSLMDYY
jgi:hypothetical protein